MVAIAAFHEPICAIGLEAQLNSRRTDMQRFYNDSPQGKGALIAHGGGIGEFVYTNCREAVEDSLSRGFRYIELDLLETADEKIVAAHDWQMLANFTGKTKNELETLPLSELKKLRIKGKYTVLGSEDICEIMDKNPEMILVTDKITNVELLLKELPYPDRMIVELKKMRHYRKALEIGLKYPAFSTRRVHKLETYQFPIAVTRVSALKDPEKAERIRKLHEQKVTLLVFDSSVCDKPEFIEKHLGKSISMIYTDEHTPTISNDKTDCVE